MIKHFIVAMGQTPGQSSTGNLVQTLVLFGAIILIFYFMILRPQQKHQSEHKKMLTSLKKGDKVVTSSGVHGTIVGVDDSTFLVQISDNTKVKYEKNAITRIIKSAEGEA